MEIHLSTPVALTKKGSLNYLINKNLLLSDRISAGKIL